MALETPEAGGRVVLTRGAVDDSEVTYEVGLHAPGGTWQSKAGIRVDDGEVTFTAFDGEGDPPDWLVGMARAFLRTVWVGRQKESPPRWPRRLRRWRAPKP